MIRCHVYLPERGLLTTVKARSEAECLMPLSLEDRIAIQERMRATGAHANSTTRSKSSVPVHGDCRDDQRARLPSIGAVNPILTIIANALRVADAIKVRLGA